MKKMIFLERKTACGTCVGKGFLDVFHELDADIFCIQESKLQEGQIDLDLPGLLSVLELCSGKKDIRVQRSLQNRNRCLYDMESTSRNMIRKDV